MYTEPKVNKYKLVDYVDVWGNPIDGWQVNLWFNDYDTDDTCLRIAEDATDEEIIDFLIQIGYLASESKGNIYLESHDNEIIEIVNDISDYPIGRLEMIG